MRDDGPEVVSGLVRECIKICIRVSLHRIGECAQAEERLSKGAAHLCHCGALHLDRFAVKLAGSGAARASASSAASASYSRQLMNGSWPRANGGQPGKGENEVTSMSKLTQSVASTMSPTL